MSPQHPAVAAPPLPVHQSLETFRAPNAGAEWLKLDLKISGGDRGKIATEL